MNELVAKTLFSRRNIFQVVVLASLIALGVNLMSDWFSDYVGQSIWIKWVVGLLLIFLGFLPFMRFLLQDKTVNKDMEGVVFLNPSKKSLVNIDDYNLSEGILKAFRGAFLENSALRASWEAEPLFREPERDAPKAIESSIDETEEKEKSNEVSYAAIVRMQMDLHDRPLSEKSVLLEAIEFCILEFLSLHLSEYFGNFDDKDKHVCTLTRTDIPHILLENRILSLLSTPIEDRQIFLDSGFSKNPPKGEVHSILGSDGSVYERFDLKLPTGTRILRPSPGCIRLQHRRFTLNINSAFHGFGQNLPPYFQELYIGKPGEKVDARQIHFQIRAQLHSLALLHLNRWEYYRWIDSFIRYFESHVSFDAFLERIQWAATASHIRATLIREHLRKEKKRREIAAPSAETPTPAEPNTAMHRTS